MAFKKKKKVTPKRKPVKKKKVTPKRKPVKKKKVTPKRKPVKKKKVTPKRKPVKKKKVTPKRKPVKKKKVTPKRKPVKKKKPKPKPKPKSKPKPKPKPKTKPVKKPKLALLPSKRKVPVYEVSVGDPRGYQEMEPTPARYTSSSKGNVTFPGSVDDIFMRTFINHARKGPFFDDIDGVQIYRYGTTFRIEGVFSDYVEERIKIILEEYPGASIHLTQESENNFSLRINLGSPNIGAVASDVADDLKKNKSILGDIYLALVENYGDVDWFVFFDTEDSLYE